MSAERPPHPERPARPLTSAPSNETRERDYPLASAEPGDAADQADRLSTIMTSEALRNARAGGDSGADRADVELDGWSGLPLTNTDDLRISEDMLEDSSDDPGHAGGEDLEMRDREQWIPAEVAAMHIVELGPGGEFDVLDDDVERQRDEERRR